MNWKNGDNRLRFNVNPQAAFILAVTTILLGGVACIVSISAHVPRRFIRASVILVVIGIIGLGISGAWYVLESTPSHTQIAMVTPTPEKSPTPNQPSPLAMLEQPSPSPSTTVPTVMPAIDSTQIETAKGDWFSGQLPGMLPPDPSALGPNRWAKGYYHNEVLNNTDSLVTYKTIGPGIAWITVVLQPHAGKTQWWGRPDIAVIELVAVEGRPSAGLWRTEAQYSKKIITHEDAEARYLPHYRFEQNARGQVELHRN